MMSPITRAEIDLSAIGHNVRALRDVTLPGVRLMAVVKADGYGHGAVEVAKTALQNGASRLAVARMNEARVLREAGIQAPVLLFGCISPREVREAIALELAISLSSCSHAEAVSREAGRLGCRLKVHFKLDTGMGRLGFQPDCLNSVCGDAVRALLQAARLPWLDVDGIFTHFANADCFDKSHAREQFRVFMELLDELKSNGLEVSTRHAANSAATIEMPETHLDMVRPGISIYGLYPSDEVDKSLINLIPAMTLKSTAIQVKQVPAGFKVSYGSTFITPRLSTIATVPIGYADGYSRLLSSRGHMLVHGRKAPIVGRVCMDLSMIDVTDIPEVREGDEVVVLGKQGQAELPAEEVASALNTINYEVVSSITSRVPRIYV